MKVSTDACIQGAWAAAFLKENTHLRTALDIGTGTGLLSLMLLQKSPGLFITAIEKEAKAALQAMENFVSAPWGKSITLVADSLQSWTDRQQRKGALPQFDFIISNPPFFNNQLAAPAAGRKMARHDSLSVSNLAGAISLLLNADGVSCVMYPTREWPQWEYNAVSAGLYPFRLLHVRPTAKKTPNRIIGLFSKHRKIPAREELTIYDSDGTYNVACLALLKDYYLKL